MAPTEGQGRSSEGEDFVLSVMEKHGEVLSKRMTGYEISFKRKHLAAAKTQNCPPNDGVRVNMEM